MQLITTMILAMDIFSIASLCENTSFEVWSKIFMSAGMLASYVAFFYVQCYGDTVVRRVIGRCVFYFAQIGVAITCITTGAWYAFVPIVFSLLAKTFFTIVSAPKS